VKTYCFGPFQLIAAKFELHRNDVRLHMERRVHDLLVYLIENRERVVSSDELLANLWSGTKVSQGSVTRAIRILRRTLEDEPAEPLWIATRRGRGYRFIGAIDEQNRPPGPVAVIPSTADPFVGRTCEIAVLRHAIDTSCSGTGQACFIAGEPGIGKTRLCREISRLARARGMIVLNAWCHDGEGAPSYWPWVQILRSYASDRDPKELRQDLGPGGDVVSRTIPELNDKLGTNEHPPALSADEARFHFFDSVARLFVRASRRRPLMLFLDDLHSMDGPSLRLLEFLCREIENAGLLIVVAHRNAAIDLREETRDALGRITRQSHCHRIELKGLARDDVAELLERLADGTPSASWIDEVHNRTGGNPFFVRQLASTEVEKSSGRSIIPAAVRDLLVSRISRLSVSARELLTSASIVSTEWPGDLVRGICEMSLDVFSRGLEECLHFGLIRETAAGREHFRFVHALVRETLYSELLIARRRDLHRAAMEWLEAWRMDIDPAELAYHAYHSAAHDGGCKGLEYSTQAAELATRRLAYEDAALQWRRALEMLELKRTPDYTRCRSELLIGLGESYVRSGERSAADAAFRAAAEHARDLRSGELLARIALGRAPGLIALEIDRPDVELISLLHEALELCDDAPQLRAQLLSRLVLAQAWSLPRAMLRPWVEESIRLADQVGDVRIQAFARSVRCMTFWSPHNSDERDQETRDVMEWAKRSGDRELQALGYLYRITTLMEHGDPIAVKAEVRSFEHMARELRQPQALWYQTGFRTITAFLEGRFADVRRLQTELRAVSAATGDKNPLHVAALHDVFISAEEGEFEQGLAVCAEMRLIYPPYLGGYSWFLAELGRREEAQQTLDLLIANDFERCPPSLNQLPVLAAMAETCDIMGASGSAEPLYLEMLPYRDRMGIGGYAFLSWGAMARTLGLLATILGRWTEAEDLLEQALELNARNGANVWTVRTHYNYARMLRARGARGDDIRAREHVEIALPLATTCGMRVLAERLKRMSH
jgi:DNA-binding winged helix-turn-helix (wHTH) protein/tetratricopeptide (TPR) repeat protein